MGIFLKKEGCIGITLFHWSPETVFLDMEESSFWPVKSHQRKNTCAHPPPATHHRVGYRRLLSIRGHRSWSKSVPHAALELPDGWQKLMGVLTSCLRSCNCVHDFKKHWGVQLWSCRNWLFMWHGRISSRLVEKDRKVQWTCTGCFPLHSWFCKNLISPGN